MLNFRSLLARSIGLTITVIGIALASVSHSFPVLAYDGITNPSTGSLGDDPNTAMSGETFVTYFIYIWNAMMVVGGLIVLFFFIQAAIEWITAGGDTGKIQKARDRMIQSTIGLFILVMSFVIVNFISAILFGDNFNILNLTLPSPDSPAPQWYPPTNNI